MHERFTDRARKVMQLAEDEANRLNHEYVGTEHILLGLVAERFGVAGAVLKNLGVDLPKARLTVEGLAAPLPPSNKSNDLPVSPRARQAVATSHEEAAKIGHGYVGTEHLILALTRDADSVAAKSLLNLGLKLDDIREEVLKLLGHNLDRAQKSRPRK